MTLVYDETTLEYNGLNKVSPESPLNKMADISSLLFNPVSSCDFNTVNGNGIGLNGKNDEQIYGSDTCHNQTDRWPVIVNVTIEHTHMHIFNKKHLILF